MAAVATDLEAVADEAAQRAGVPVAMFRRQIGQESGWNPQAYNAGSGATGIAQIVPRWHPDVDPRDPVASLWYAARLMAGYRARFGSWAKALAAYNWGSGNVGGYTHEGKTVPPWDGGRETLPAETRHYLDVILGEGWPDPESNVQKVHVTPTTLRTTEDGVRLRSGPGTDSRILATLAAGTEVVPLTDHAWRQVNVGGQLGWIAADLLREGSDSTQSGAQSIRSFDSNTPTYFQRQDWTCSIGSVIWMLRSIGIDVTPDEAQDAMSPRYVTPDLGLLNADGSGIVAVLRDQWGVAAENHAAVTFDEVAAWAGKMPVAIGGRNWGGPGKGHWSAVRGYDGTRLLLANPASGTVYGDASLTREQWSWRGPWSAVVVPLPSPGVGTGPSASNDEDTILGLRAAVAHLTDVVVPKAAAAAAEREAALAEAKRIRAEFVGVKP